jgi:hypothetical protein
VVRNPYSQYSLLILVVYTSPFTGKTFNLDYRANWQPLPPPPPPPKTLTWDVKWDFNHGHGKSVGNVEKAAPVEVTTTTTTTLKPPPKAPAEPIQKTITWDVKWDFNHGHGQGSSVGNVEKAAPVEVATTTTTTPKPPPKVPKEPVKKVVTWDVKWDFQHGVNNDAAPAPTTQAPATVSSSNNGQIGHKKIDVQWSVDYNHGGSASTPPTQTSSPEKPINGDENDIDPAENHQ